MSHFKLTRLNHSTGLEKLLWEGDTLEAANTAWDTEFVYCHHVTLWQDGNPIDGTTFDWDSRCRKCQRLYRYPTPPINNPVKLTWRWLRKARRRVRWLKGRNRFLKNELKRHASGGTDGIPF